MGAPRFRSERAQLDLFRSIPGDIPPPDAQDLMAWPFFSLAKLKRVTPIDFHMGDTWILVEATAEHGMVTIWDADVLIWAASQIVEARDAGRPISRLMATTPHEILTFIGRGTGRDNYDRLKAALDRLQSTTVATSIRQPLQRRRHRFSWISGRFANGQHPSATRTDALQVRWKLIERHLRELRAVGLRTRSPRDCRRAS